MNDLELSVARRFERGGWTVLRRGWPDLLCVNWTLDQIDNYGRDAPPLRAFGLEVKAELDSVTVHQQRIHNVLSQLGLACHVAKGTMAETRLYRVGYVEGAHHNRILCSPSNPPSGFASDMCDVSSTTSSAPGQSCRRCVMREARKVVSAAARESR